MIKKIVISHFNNIAAILQKNRIEEIVTINHDYQVNDIYLGVVHKIFSSINAAFVKLNKYGKSGFIHISDIKNLKKYQHLYNINQLLAINQLILVQVIKEPTINKGPRLTTNIHLHGKYLVLMPFCNLISISHKIHDCRERLYLHSLALLIKPETMGLLIKPSAQGVPESFILQDLDSIKNQWAFIQKTMIATSAPILIYKDEDLIKKVIRDFYEKNIKKIIVDSYDDLKLVYYYFNKWNYISSIDITLQVYNKSESILEKFNIKQTIKEVLKPKVLLWYGGSIIIEKCEALTIIDVNSGSFNKADNSKETILKTNFYAAIEIAYQLRIRNLNGVIIVDFIDMYSQRDQLQLLEHFSLLLNFDTAKPQIVQLSELGLVELTRRRRSQSISEIFGNLKDYNMDFCLSNKIPMKFLCKSIVSNDAIKKSLIINKQIKSLFFTKQFKNNISLKCKKNFLNNYQKINKYQDFFYTEQDSVYIFNPKANYLMPFLFYICFMKYN